MSSVYGFARQSGGSVNISSEAGIGTTVAIYLPRAIDQVDVVRPDLTDDRAPAGDAELILVVEDNERVRRVTLARLESLGYTVLEAQNGPEALEILKSDSEVELVLCDVVMPGGMNGYEVAGWIRANRPDLKVLLSSGYNDIAAKHAHSNERPVLPKPYTRMQLARTMRELLEN